MPNQHALLSPSSSERWLHCPKSVRLSEQFEDTTSVYASEGTEAHALCEHLVLTALGRHSTDPRSWFKQYSQEMQEAAEGYTAYIVQGISRDILCYAMRTLQCCSIVAHVHDELIIEADPRMSLLAVCEQMGRTPPWAKGLILRADGYECNFYKKD